MKSSLMFFTKNKNKFVLVLIVFLALFFVVIFRVQAIEPIIKITKIQYDGGSGKSDEDFIEISNLSSSIINLDGYRLVKRTGTGTVDTSIKSWSSYEAFLPGTKYVWANSRSGFATSIGANTSTTETISDTNQIAFRFGKLNEGLIIDSINWKKDPEEKPKEDPPIKKVYSDKIYINELLPAPSTTSGDDEFIELYNPTEENEDLADWILRDGSKSGKYIFPKNTILKSKTFFVVYKKDFKFALNNSGEETVYLFDPTEKEISRVKYSSAKADYAYALDGEIWRWTPTLTPGKENVFAEILSGKIEKDETIYAGVYANFEAIADDKAKHFTWNFGDGHKSYLQKTRHYLS